MKFSASGTNLRALTKTIALQNWMFLMRVSCVLIPFLLVCANLLLAGPGAAQKLREVKVTLGLTGEPLKAALHQLESQTSYSFAFVESEISVYDRLYLPKRTRTLPETLALLLSGTNLRYTVKRSTIAIFQTDAPALRPVLVENIGPPTSVQALAPPVRGKVTDQQNTPLSGVSIIVKGTKNGVTTDAQGNFTINIADGNQKLIISNVGFVTQEITVGNSSSLSVTLQADDSKMEDVVVIGYGTTKKKDLTGAVTSVNVKKIEEVPLPSIDQLLSGRVGGVQINQASGQAGAGTSIRIRGGNSLNGTNEPLFVVDGFPIINDNDAYSPSGPLGLTNAGSGNPRQGNSTGALNWLNPSDIESIEVLKDASATAIYGSRGANGVIIITTKRGKAGQTRINLTSSVGFSALNDNKIQMMNGSEYAAYSNLYNAEKKAVVWYKDTTVDGKLFPTPDKVGEGTNWINEVTRTGLSQNYSLGFSGGKEMLFAGSVSMLDQKTPMLGSRYKRGSFRLNVQSALTNWLNFENSFAFSLSTVDNSPSDSRDVQKFGAFEAALASNPAEPAYKSDGSLNYAGGVVDNATSPNVKYSPIALATDVLNRNNIQTVVNNLSLKAHIAKGINFEVRGSLFSNDALRDIYYNSQTTFNGFMVGGLGGKNTNSSKSYLIENFATLNKTIGKNVLSSLLGYSYQKTDYRTVAIGASGFPNNNLLNENIAAGSTQYPTQTNRVEDLLSSYFIRLNNIINDKYLLTFTGRLDGSSKFGAGNKWAFFPSGAFSWKIKEEDFMRDVPTFSDLKLRISYGLSGNQAIQSLQSKFLLGVNNYPFGGTLQTGIFPAVLGNAKLKWETTRQFNLGLDFGFADQRVTGSANYYIKNTDNLLQQKVVPTNSGYSSILDNIGSISNKGIELELHASVIKGGKFSWDIDANIAHNKQKLTDLGLGNVDTLLVGFAVVGGSSSTVALIKGQPVGQFYGYRNKGVYTDDDDLSKSPHLPGAKAGTRKIRDLNGDGEISDKDREVIGDPNPDFTYGIVNSFTYGAFDLNFVIQGVSGGNVWNLGDYILSRLGNRQKAALDYWTPSHHNASYPAPGQDVGTDNHGDFSIESASYLRLKSIALGYNVPVGKIRFIRSLRFFASASNVLTITGYNGFDPEINSFAQSNLFRNIDILTVPLYKTYTFGLNIGL